MVQRTNRESDTYLDLLRDSVVNVVLLEDYGRGRLPLASHVSLLKYIDYVYVVLYVPMMFT